jgi:hypothetical protein
MIIDDFICKRKIKIFMKKLAILSSFALLGAVSLASLSAKPAIAKCGWGDITCNPKDWTCPPGGCNTPPPTIIKPGPTPNHSATTDVSSLPSDGRYEIRSNGQIFFYPANGGNPVVVYNGSGKAVAIIRYGGAIYTAFDRGYIYRSPDGQNLGGGGSTSSVYRGSATVNAMIACQDSIFTAFKGGYIYRSPDGQNLGGGGNTSSVYRGSQQVNRMQCVDGNVVTSFDGGGVYQSPDGNNLGGGGKTRRLN